MPLYRFYVVQADGHIAGMPEILDCVDDDEAIHKAKERLDTRAIEVWNLARRVTRLEPDH